jgi:predicted ATP-dependent protease
MTGSLSVRGNVLPIGGATLKAEAAYKAGIKRIILPKQNFEDLHLDKSMRDDMEIITVETFADVLRNVLPPEFVDLADKFKTNIGDEAFKVIKSKKSVPPGSGTPA